MKNYNYIQWNNREDELLLKMRRDGFSFYKIANEFGVTKGTVVSRWHVIKPRTAKKEISRAWSYII